jgi:hypothetical protein
MEKTFEVKAEIKIKLTQNDIDDIMSCALDGGITYWCDDAEVVGEYLGEFASDQISRGGKLILHDSEEDKSYDFGIDEFLKGIQLYFESGGRIATEDGEIDIGDVDAEIADCIVQYGIFGEIVFG